MQHQFQIEQAFKTTEFRQAISTAIEWAPELKHEGLVTTMLSSMLSKSKLASAREVRAEATRKSRRYDMTIEGIPLEAKYYLEYDIEFIYQALDRPISPGGLLVHKPQSSWHAGYSFLKELGRTRNSYFLWSICDRGSNPHDKACMRKNTAAWLNKLGQSGETDARTYLCKKLSEVVQMSVVAFDGLEIVELEPVIAGNNRLRSFLYFHPGGA